MRALIENHRVIVCTGSGGVGKTTTAAALAVAAAKMGRRVLVLTIDPARRLATTLGIARSNNDVRVKRQHYPGELWAGMINPPQVLAEYVRRYSRDRAAADRLFDNALYKQLSTTLSGSQEFTSLARLLDAAECGKYDLVILDTPPTSHAADFLSAPERLNAVFDSAIVSMFMGRATGFGLVAGAWKRSVKLLLGTLTIITGSEFVANFSSFFSAIDAIAPAIRETNLGAHRLLLDPTTAFVLITSYDTAKIQEGEAFHDELNAAGYHLRKVIVNRAWPVWAKDDQAARRAVKEQLTASGQLQLATLHSSLCNYYDWRQKTHTSFKEILHVPEMEDEVIGLEALEQLAAHLCSSIAPSHRQRK